MNAVKYENDDVTHGLSMIVAIGSLDPTKSDGLRRTVTNAVACALSGIMGLSAMACNKDRIPSEPLEIQVARRETELEKSEINRRDAMQSCLEQSLSKRSRPDPDDLFGMNMGLEREPDEMQFIHGNQAPFTQPLVAEPSDVVAECDAKVVDVVGCFAVVSRKCKNVTGRGYYIFRWVGLDKHSFKTFMESWGGRVYSDEELLGAETARYREGFSWNLYGGWVAPEVPGSRASHDLSQEQWLSLHRDLRRKYGE